MSESDRGPGRGPWVSASIERRRRAVAVCSLLVLLGAFAGYVGAPVIPDHLTGDVKRHITFGRGWDGLWGFRMRCALGLAFAGACAATGAWLWSGLGFGRRFTPRAVVAGLVALLGAGAAGGQHRMWQEDGWLATRSMSVPSSHISDVPAGRVGAAGGVAALVAGAVLGALSWRRRPARGERFVCRRDTVVRVVTYDDPFADGLAARLPKGEVVWVEHFPPHGSDRLWVVPERRELLETALVPEEPRGAPGYDGYVLTVTWDDLRARFRRLREPGPRPSQPVGSGQP